MNEQTPYGGDHPCERPAWIETGFVTAIGYAPMADDDDDPDDGRDLDRALLRTAVEAREGRFQ